MIQKFLGLIVEKPSHLWAMYAKWFRQLIRYHGAFSLSLWLPILPFITLPVGLIVGALLSPYKFQVNTQGSARIAELRDINKIALLGFDGFSQVVGKFKGRFLMLKETLSTLCCAPPGTGKTAGVVIPTIFNSDKLSIIVNDPKP